MAPPPLVKTVSILIILLVTLIDVTFESYLLDNFEEYHFKT